MRSIRSTRVLGRIVAASALAGSTFAIFAGVGAAAATTRPVNATPPTISGTAQDGKTLTGNRGTWDNTPTDYDYQWRRCTSTGIDCTNIVGATRLVYTLTSADVGHALRFRVVAKNADGARTAVSAPTDAVKPATTPTTTTTTTTTTVTTTAPPPAVNHRPSIRILGVRFVGVRVYVRMRVCDDSHRRVNIIERDSRRAVPSYTRRFRTLVPPRPCSTLTRSWMPAPRFRHRITITLWARDYAGLTSLPARRSFVR